MCFWAEAFKIIECWNRREKAYQVTELGRSLLDNETGADPYLESDESVWLLHWQLVKAPQVAKAWHWFFNYNYALENREIDLLMKLQEWSKEQSDKVAGASLKADIRCLLKMYVDEGKGKTEEILFHRFHELRLLSQFEDSLDGERRIFFNQSIKPGLSPTLFAYFCIDHAESLRVNQIDFAQLQYQPGCPNRAMMLSTGNFMELLDRWLRNQSEVQFIEEDQKQFLRWECSTSELKAKLWNQVYRERGFNL